MKKKKKKKKKRERERRGWGGEFVPDPYRLKEALSEN